ncbi:drug/metabolite transporter (DMT)-like permease [Rhodothalassium salexigens DSM 2132]|uniref:Drug/metabolite transporter (DMT)-like permease n=1 Tax=Rhodothalassium salexigens DSM 2132 TaxID=1188247 RepID=A0A4R2PPD0_RHOSA|nr:DMT family transporter [Rhodothalassium salexigens]MBB4210823.1 drug/metabolite transporter (DMT)-like permease [Rhodothalassium salexigens DSM 2132]TCP37622.1 drug/metabolite transporter (DMT)-like permease [Rhodothalassium salexigens DSM 2132]
MPGRPRAADYGLLATLALLWGSSYLFTDLALDGFTAVQVTAGRIVVGALALLAYGAVHQRRADPRPQASVGDLQASVGDLVMLLLAGLTGAVLPFALLAWAQEAVTSSMTAILIATVPLWTMALARLMARDEPVDAGRLAGALLGLVGVAVLMGGAGVDAPPTPRALAVLGAALCYALTGLILRRVDHLPAPVSAAGLQVFAALAILPVGAVDLWRQGAVGGTLAVTSIAVLGLFASGLAPIVMVRLLNRTGATFVSFNNLLVPVVGTLLGIALLGETVGPRQAVGLGLVLLSVAATRRGA